jgi:hypothetical protein
MKKNGLNIVGLLDCQISLHKSKMVGINNIIVLTELLD